jgi:hypothetical protein
VVGAHQDRPNSLKDATVSHPRLPAPVLYGTGGRYHSSARNHRGSVRVFRTVCAPTVSGNSARTVHSRFCHRRGLLGVLRRGGSGTARWAAVSAHGTDAVPTAVLPTVSQGYPWARPPLRLAQHLRRKAQLRALFHAFNGRYVMLCSFLLCDRDTPRPGRNIGLPAIGLDSPAPCFPPRSYSFSHHAARDGTRLRNLYCDYLARSS